MKKKFALLIGVLLILVALFASCGQTAATKRHTRWAKDESHTFNITLSDFADDGNTLFKNYVKTIREQGDDDKVTETKLTCYKDDVISDSEYAFINNTDQLRPVDVKGEYTLNIKENTATTWKVETHQVIYSQYETAKLQELNCLELFSKSECNVTDKEENPFANNSERITLRSETKSSVIFVNDEDQSPVSSTTENKGYYIGKIAQAESNYKYETTYDLDNRKVSVKKDDGEAEERALEIGKGVKCIDANQLLTYIRSLDKSAESFQDVPSVMVYDVTTNKISTASFSMRSRQFNLKIDNADLTETIVALHAISVTVGGMPFIAQYNLPDLTESSYDYLPQTNGKRCKYTTIKFRSGWYSYELQPDDALRQALDSIKKTDSVNQ